MFGVAIWDKQKKKLLLYRDRIGKKPLYYAIKGNRIIFASEIKALFGHGEVSKDLDFKALYHYFGLKNTSAPRTAFADIRQLMPGCFLVWQGGKVDERSYWHLDFGDALTDITEEEAAQHLFALFEDAGQDKNGV